MAIAAIINLPKLQTDTINPPAGSASLRPWETKCRPPRATARAARRPLLAFRCGRPPCKDLAVASSGVGYALYHNQVSDVYPPCGLRFAPPLGIYHVEVGRGQLFALRARAIQYSRLCLRLRLRPPGKQRSTIPKGGSALLNITRCIVCVPPTQPPFGFPFPPSLPPAGKAGGNDAGLLGPLSPPPCPPPLRSLRSLPGRGVKSLLLVLRFARGLRARSAHRSPLPHGRASVAPEVARYGVPSLRYATTRYWSFCL